MTVRVVYLPMVHPVEVQSSGSIRNPPSICSFSPAVRSATRIESTEIHRARSPFQPLLSLAVAEREGLLDANEIKANGKT